VTDSAQRATLVLEHSIEDAEWFVVAYLVRDSGQRERKTLTSRDSRDQAAEALESIWNRMLDRA
jgi:hypothetical protein